MEKDRQHDIGLMRYGAISPAIAGVPENYDSIIDYFRKTSENGIMHPNGEIRHYSPHTLRKWYQTYNHKGFDGLLPKGRSDAGQARKMDDDTAAYVIRLKGKHPRLPATVIYQQLIDDGIISRGDISESTVSRFIRNLDLPDNGEKEVMRRYERPHINEAWYGDSSVGPYIKDGTGRKRKIYIIALIDDASRFIIGAGAFYNDNFVNLMAVLKSAISKYGCPRLLSFDNGSTYHNKQMGLLAARLGITLHYCRPYTPTQKAKIERWFATCKSHWMAAVDYRDFNTLEAVDTSLSGYVLKYNTTVHSSLNGMTPQERFFAEPGKIRRIGQDILDRSFLLEMSRKASADGIISFMNAEYELDFSHADRKVSIRYTPDMDEVYVVEDDGSLTAIRPLNKHDNANVKRSRLRLSGGAK